MQIAARPSAGQLPYRASRIASLPSTSFTGYITFFAASIISSGQIQAHRVSGVTCCLPGDCTECTVGLINAIELHANQSKYTVNINPELISCILNLIEASKPGADRTKSTEITVKLGDLDTLLRHFFWQDCELRRLNPQIPTEQKG